MADTSDASAIDESMLGESQNAATEKKAETLTDHHRHHPLILEDEDESEEAVYTKHDIDIRDKEIYELKEKQAELMMEMDFSLKRKDIAYQEEIRELNEKFTTEMDALNAQLEEFKTVNDKNLNEYNMYLIEVKKQHDATVDNMEAHYNTKLVSEFEKYNALQILLEETIKECESRIHALESDRGKAVEELVEYFETKIKVKNTALETAFTESKLQMKENEEMKRQIEEDADQEILELTTSYERKLRHERSMNAKFKGEAGVMSKKIQTMQKEIEERMNEVQRLHAEYIKMSNIIKDTEREVVKLQKQLVDTETASTQKDKTIVDLQKSNTDLEKFKFVLEHRITELRKHIEPKAREIVFLKQQISDMEQELDSTISVRSGLQMQASELQNKLKIADREYNSEKKTRMRYQVLLERLRGHMARCMSVLHDHKSLKSVVRAMHQKYGEGLEAGKASSAEQEAICELVRQKQHLEISLTSIKRKLAKDAQFTRVEQLKIMHENMLLVSEINNLRTELKRTRDKLLSYENTLGFNQVGGIGEAAEMRFKLQRAIEERDDIEVQHDNIVEAKMALIHAQEEEIDTLSTKVLKIQEYVHDARPEGGLIGNSGADHIRSVLSSAVSNNEG